MAKAKKKPAKKQKPKTTQIKVQYGSPEDLIPYANNTKKHPERQIELLMSSFKEFSFDVPIVVNKDMVIIKGHARREAAIRAGLSEVPYIIRTDLSEAQVRASRIADNKLSESEWDYDTLKIEMQGLKELGMNLEHTGFETNIIDAILSTPEELNYDGFGNFDGDGNEDSNGEPRDKKEIEGNKDGRRIVVMISFGAVPTAEKFCELVGVMPAKFAKNSETKAVDGDVLLSRTEELIGYENISN